MCHARAAQQLNMEKNKYVSQTHTQNKQQNYYIAVNEHTVKYSMYLLA